MKDMLLVGLAALPALLLVVDPLGALPLFLMMTAADTPAERRAIALRAAVATGIILSLFAVGGVFVFDLFGISLSSFRIAGGLFLLRIGLHMLAARPARPASARSHKGADVALIPLALPLLAGPGAITTVLVHASQRPGLGTTVAVLVAIAVTAFLTWLVLRGAEAIESRLSRKLLDVLGPVMGLLLAAIAVEFMVTGVREAATHP